MIIGNISQIKPIIMNKNENQLNNINNNVIILIVFLIIFLE